MVLISKADKRKVFLHLLQEGVIVFKKDYSMTEHADTKVPHLFVWMLMRSLKDKGFLELVFNWRYFYYYITTEGVAHLRTQLGIEDDSIAPVTFINKKKNYGEEGAEEGADRPRRKFGGGDKGFGRGGRGRFGAGRPKDGEEGATEAPVVQQE